jgi:hypothetical protein
MSNLFPAVSARRVMGAGNSGTDDETRFRSTIEALDKLGLRSLCALPLSTAHHQLGSLVFASQTADAYSPEEVQFLSIVVGRSRWRSTTLGRRSDWNSFWI